MGSSSSARQDQAARPLAAGAGVLLTRDSGNAESRGNAPAPSRRNLWPTSRSRPPIMAPISSRARQDPRWRRNRIRHPRADGDLPLPLRRLRNQAILRRKPPDAALRRRSRARVKGHVGVACRHASARTAPLLSSSNGSGSVFAASGPMLARVWFPGRIKRSCSYHAADA
jgi:hypothetical protein